MVKNFTKLGQQMFLRNGEYFLRQTNVRKIYIERIEPILL